MSGRRTRVVLACERLDIAGGVERFVCQLADHLAQAGFDAAVATAGTALEHFAYPLRDDVTVLHGSLPAQDDVNGALPMLWRQWRVGHALSTAIRAFEPDVVVLNGLVTACSLFTVDRSLISQTICCDHNHFGARSRIWQKLRRYFYPKVAAVVSLTRADEPNFKALNANTETIYNASPLQANVPVANPNGVVLAAGRFVAQKGFDLLLEAWEIVCQQVPHVKLRIVGEGALAEELLRHVDALNIADENRVEFRPATRDMPAQFRDAMLFVLSSRYEGMPLVLLEAQALGVPCVAFACPTGPDEILTPETGIVVEPGSIRSLAQAMVELITDAPRRERMAVAAQLRSLEVFGVDEHLGRWTALIRRVAKQVAAA